MANFSITSMELALLNSSIKKSNQSIAFRYFNTYTKTNAYKSLKHITILSYIISQRKSTLIISRKNCLVNNESINYSDKIKHHSISQDNS